MRTTRPRCELLGTIEGGGYEKRLEETRRVYATYGISPTVTTKRGGGHEPKILESSNPLRIRRLTPFECWRLMDFSDEDFNRVKVLESNTQLYAQAGNSIVVNCLVAIFGQMFEGKEDIYKERT